MTFGSLFAGIGGFDLGFERAGMQCKWQVEIDPFCRKVLAKHWPDVTRFEDVRKVGSHNLEYVDVICGGFPCQDISNAGNISGIEAERSGLWFEYARIIRALRPRIVVVENVAALLVRGVDRVFGELAASGYDCEWFLLPASGLGAWHFRCRIFIIAVERILPNPDEVGTKVLFKSIAGGPLSRDRLAIDSRTWEKPQPDLLRGFDGIPQELDASRIGSIGNAVVPQVAEWIGRRIMANK